MPSYQLTAEDVVSVEQTVVDGLTTSSDLLFRDGMLLRGPPYPTTYVITYGQRRPFESSWIFDYLGYSRSNIAYVSNDVIRLHPMGGPITGH